MTELSRWRLQYWLTTSGVLLWRGLCTLPMPVLRLMGRAVGAALYFFLTKRRAVALRNVSACFSEKNPAWHRQVVRDHFRQVGYSIFTLGLLCWGKPQRLARRVHITGLSNLKALENNGHAVIFLAPHFVDALCAGLYLSSQFPLTAMYKQPRNPVFHAMYKRVATGCSTGDGWLDWLAGNQRHGNIILVEHRKGLRPVVRDLKRGRYFYYLPDQDLGRRQTVFAPFFSIPAVSSIALGRFAKLGNARVVPVFPRYNAASGKFEIELGEPLASIPGANAVEEATNANAAIEAFVRRHPQYYFWLHKRFKTRPAGEADFYRHGSLVDG